MWCLARTGRAHSIQGRINPSMKKSDWVTLTVLGLYGTSMFHHGNVYRDSYPSREACLKDWGNTTKDCRSDAGTAGGTGLRFYEPSYEEKARPQTANPALRNSVSLVQRGGFGRSGAHFTRGG